MSDDGVLDISEHLRNSDTLQVFRMSLYNIYLDLDFTMKFLCLSKEQLADTGAILILVLLCNSTTIEVLDISKNNIRSNSHQQWSKQKLYIKKLNISHNMIGSKGVISIIHSFQNNVALQVLDITQ